MPNMKRSSVIGKDDLIPFSMHEVPSIITLSTTKKMQSTPQLLP